MDKYVVIDIGGTAIKYGVMNTDGIILEKKEIPTESHLGGNHILDQVISIVSGYVNSEKISGVSISTAGIVDSQSGKIIYASELLPGYTGINIKETIDELFHIPCEIENDVNCAGLAECMSGASKSTKCSVMLTIGTGIGGALIIDNKIYHGFSNSACEVGRMNVDGNPFEKVAATSVLVKKVAERKKENINSWNGKKVMEYAKAGDEICNQALDEMADLLAKGIANICYVVNPEMVVLGGGIMAQGSFIKEKLMKSLSENLTEIILQNTTITFAKHENNAGMIGAFYNFIQKNS